MRNDMKSHEANRITNFEKHDTVRNESNNALYMDVRFWLALLSLVGLMVMSI